MPPLAWQLLWSLAGRTQLRVDVSALSDYQQKHRARGAEVFFVHLCESGNIIDVV